MFWLDNFGVETVPHVSSILEVQKLTLNFFKDIFIFMFLSLFLQSNII